MHPDRVWTLAELVQEADLSSADVQLAVERLILHGELLRDGGDRYRRPVSGE